MAELRNSFQKPPGTAAAPEQVQSQMNQIQELQTKHANEQREQQILFQKEMQELQSLFRQQNNPNDQHAPALAMQTPPPLPANSMLVQQHQPDLVSSVMPQNYTNPSNPETSIDTAAFQSTLTSSLTKFWSSQMEEMIHLPIGDEQDFKNHNDLPLARIKRIMKSDEDVRMISAEAPVLFAKACEMFILELTLRSWAYSESNKRRTLQKEDIQMAIQRTDIFDFLVDVIN